MPVNLDENQQAVWFLWYWVPWISQHTRADSIAVSLFVDWLILSESEANPNNDLMMRRAGLLTLGYFIQPVIVIVILDDTRSNQYILFWAGVMNSEHKCTQSYLYYFEQLVMHSTPFCSDRWQQPSRSNNTTTPPWVAVPIKTQVLNYSNIKTETKTIPLKLCDQLLCTLRLYAQILICFCISSWMDCSSGSHLVLGWSVHYALVTSYEYIVRAYIRWPLNIDI